MIEVKRIKFLNRWGKLEGSPLKGPNMISLKFPSIPQVTPIAYTQYGNAVSTGAGTLGRAMLRQSEDEGLKIPSKNRMYAAFFTFTGCGVAGAAAGAAISGKKAGRGRNALGGGLGAVVGLVTGYIGVRLILG